MKTIIFTFCIVVLSLWIEVSLSIFGMVAPALMMQMFYLTVVKRWRFSFLTALFACTILDSLLGYYSLPAVTFVIILASFWRSIGDCSRIELQFLPVSVTVFVAMLILFGSVYLTYEGIVPLWKWTVQLFLSVLFAALLTPLMIRFQDWLALKLHILSYTEIQREEMYSAGNK